MYNRHHQQRPPDYEISRQWWSCTWLCVRQKNRMVVVVAVWTLSSNSMCSSSKENGEGCSGRAEKRNYNEKRVYLNIYTFMMHWWLDTMMIILLYYYYACRNERERYDEEDYPEKMRSVWHYCVWLRLYNMYDCILESLLVEVKKMKNLLWYAFDIYNLTRKLE